MLDLIFCFCLFVKMMIP